jgi:hypothetical protein
MVFGTIPSTIDDLPQVNNPISEKNPYSYRMQHFGCVSGSGIYYKHILPGTKTSPQSTAMISENPNPSKFSEEEELKDEPQSKSPMVGTKITLPHSYLYFDSQKTLSETRARKVFSKKWAESGSRIIKHHAPTFVRRLKSGPKPDKEDDERSTMSEPVAQEDHIIDQEEKDELQQISSQDALCPTDMFRDRVADEPPHGNSADSESAESKNARVSIERQFILEKSSEYQMSPRGRSSARHSLNLSAEENKEPGEVMIRKHFSNKAFQFVNSRELPEPLGLEEMTPRQRAVEQYSHYLANKENQKAPAELRIRKYNYNDKRRKSVKVLKFEPESQKEEGLGT